jgi:nitrogen fixation protein NifU and related proteins
MYSQLVLDHFEHPRNSGQLPAANAVVRLDNPMCGDMLEMSLRLEGGIIAEMRFRAKGCVPTIACASRLTEMAQGLTVADALFIRREAIIDSLGGLPAASHHAAQLAVETLRAALAHGRNPG